MGCTSVTNLQPVTAAWAGITACRHRVLQSAAAKKSHVQNQTAAIFAHPWQRDARFCARQENTNATGRIKMDKILRGVLNPHAQHSAMKTNSNVQTQTVSTFAHPKMKVALCFAQKKNMPVTKLRNLAGLPSTGAHLSHAQCIVERARCHVRVTVQLHAMPNLRAAQ